MLNPDASPHANLLTRPPRFPEIFEEDEIGLEDNRCQSPTPVTRRKKPHSTSSPSQSHVLAGTLLVLPFPPLPGAVRSNYSSQYRRIIAEIDQKTNIAAAERSYYRRQWQLRI
jgi:hypothetical protein